MRLVQYVTEGRRRVGRVRAVADWLASVDFSDPLATGAPDRDGWFGPGFGAESAPAQAPAVGGGPTREG